MKFLRDPFREYFFYTYFEGKFYFFCNSFNKILLINTGLYFLIYAIFEIVRFHKVVQQRFKGTVRDVVISL